MQIEPNNLGIYNHTRCACLLERPDHQALQHTSRLACHLGPLDLDPNSAVESSEALVQLCWAAHELGVELEKVEANLDTDAHVSGVANVGADPFQNRLDCVLVSGFQGISEGASMTEGEKKSENIKWRVLEWVFVKNLIKGTRISSVS